MLTRSAARSIPAILAVILVASGCRMAGPSGPSASAVVPSAAPTTSPAVAPTTGDASAAATPSSSALAEPPAASLAVDGGDPVVGQLGSFTWGDGGSDSPWLPGAPIGVGAGEQLTVAFADVVGVAGWTARRVPAGPANGTGAVGLGTGGARIDFPAPPPGTWSVQLAVQFAADGGSATYYWQVTVR